MAHELYIRGVVEFVFKLVTAVLQACLHSHQTLPYQQTSSEPELLDPSVHMPLELNFIPKFKSAYKVWEM